MKFQKIIYNIYYFLLQSLKKQVDVLTSKKFIFTEAVLGFPPLKTIYTSVH